MPTPFSLAGLSEQQACWGQEQGCALTCCSPALCPSLPVMFPAGHEAPAVLSSSPWPVDAHPGHSVGCRSAGAEGVGAARPPRTRAQGWLLLALLGTGVLCSVSARRCLHLGKGAGHTGMLPCPVPARDRGSCWWQSCGTHHVVMLLSGFCPQCKARGPGQGRPTCLH